MKLLFLHGGPAFNDYLEEFFGGRTSLPALFYSQARGPQVDGETLLAELAQKIEAAGGDVVLVGHSWGGALAASYLQRHADPRVRGLVMISSFFHAGTVNDDYRAELARRGWDSPTQEQIFLAPTERTAAGELIPRLNESFDNALFRRVWDGFVVHYDARPWVRATRLPILNIFGSEDVRIPAASVRQYQALNPKIQNLEINGAGHFPFLVEGHRRRVVEAIDSFVAKL